MAKGEQTKKKILAETRKLLVANGFHNTSINDIIRKTGVKKGNLYYYFPSKEELGLAVLEDARDEFFEILDQSLVGQTPLKRIENLLLCLLREQQKNNFVGGCLFGNTALEMSDSNPRFAEVLKEVFSSWVDRLEVLLREAQESKLPVSNQAPRLLAKLIVAAVEGGIMMARVSKDGRDLEDCLSSLSELLGLG